MNSKQYKAVKKLFNEAIDVKSNQLEKFLNTKCNDQLVIKQVIQLLKVSSSSNIRTKNITDEVLQTVLQSTLFFPDERYVLIKQIGHGGMGSVYLAQRKSENIRKKVAIKVLQLNDDISHKRFLQETQILSQLSHPNISQFIDADFLPDGRPYVVMEFIEGASIITHCYSLDLKQKIKLFLQLCSAVKHAHRNLIIHQDIKPDNVLVTKKNQVKLLDFGISKIVGDSPKNTRTIFRAMTPAYASPEQLLGKPISVSTDIYSLGIVFYELLCGNLPFNLEGLSPIKLEKILSSNPQLKPSKQLTLSSTKITKKKIDDDLDNIALKALDCDTSERYQSVDELMNDLILFQNNQPIKAGNKGKIYQLKKFIIRNKLALLVFSILIFLGFSFIKALTEKNSAIKLQLTTISKQRDDLLLEQKRAENIASTFIFERHADFDNNGIQNTLVDQSINIGNGNLFHSHDTSLMNGPITFSLYYNSKSASQTRGGLPINIIGKGWKHSFSRSLLVGNDDMIYANAYRPDGRVIPFKNHNNHWINQNKSKERLIKSDNQWIFINEVGEREVYNKWGEIKEIQLTNHKLNFQWSASTLTVDSSNHSRSYEYRANQHGKGRKLTQVSSDNGHYIDLTYKSKSSTVIESVTDEMGRSWTFEYDLFYNLAAIKNPDGTGKVYLYEEEALPHAITAIGSIIYEGFSIFHNRYGYNEMKNQVTMASYHSKICENVRITIDYCCGKRTLSTDKGMINEYEVENNDDHWKLLSSNLSFDYPKCNFDNINHIRDSLIEQKLSQ